MKVKELIVNQYEDKEFLRYNQVKYKTICIVLDFFAICNGIDGQRSISREVVEQKIFASIKKCRSNRLIVSNALVAMELMGYVVENGKEIVIQDAGVEAYKKQIIHQIAASLTESRQSRMLTRWTIAISLFALLVSITSLCYSLAQ